MVDKSIEYLGHSYPSPIPNKRGFAIVDNWFETIKEKWNIEIKTLNFSRPNFLGKLVPKEAGFIINLNKNLFKTQFRFTLAHEIAHILSFDTRSPRPSSEIYHSFSEEKYCDKVARAMLLPKSLVDFSQFDLSNMTEDQFKMIKFLWREFQVSPWQVMLKLFETTNNTNLVCIQWKYHPKESCLRIMDHSYNRNVFIPLHDRLFIGNVLNKKSSNYSPEIAFTSGAFYQDIDLIEIGALYKKKLFSTTFPIKTSLDTYIFQIIKLDT